MDFFICLCCDYYIVSLILTRDQIDSLWQTMNIFLLFNAFEMLCFPQCVRYLLQ